MSFLANLSWKMAFKNLLRNRRRTIATGIAIIFGYVGMILVGGYLYRTKKGLEAATVYINQRGHIAILKKDAINQFTARPKKYVLQPEVLASLQGIVQDLAKKIDYSGMYLTGTGLLIKDNKSIPFSGLGLDPEAFYKSFHHPDLLKWAADWVVKKEPTDFDEFKKSMQTVSITEKMGLTLGLKDLPAFLTASEREVQVMTKSFYNDLGVSDAMLGVSHSTGQNFLDQTSLWMSLGLMQNLLGTEGVEYFALFLKDVGDTQSVVQWIRERVQQQQLDVDVFSYQDEEWNPYYVGTLSFLVVIGIFFIVLICGAVILSIANSVTMGILERTREIGTLRAIGFTTGKIQRMFVQESLVLTLICLVFGQVLSWVLSLIINNLNFRFSPPGAQGDIQFLLVLQWGISLTMGIVLILMAMVTTFFVTWQKNKLKITELLTDAGAS